MRCYHLLRQMARFYEVHAILFQKESELRTGDDDYRVPDSVCVYSPIDQPPPPSLFDRFPRRLRAGLQFRWMRRSWEGPAEGTLVRSHHLIRHVLTKICVDIVFFEHVQSMFAAPLVKRLSSKAVRILDAHNVDHDLMRQNIEDLPDKQRRGKQREIHRLREIEHNLQRHVDAVFCCSATDRTKLARHNTIPIHVVPNGVDTTARSADSRPDKSSCRNILFCGNLKTLPNINGIKWFGSAVWPRLCELNKEIKLIIVGGDGSRDDFSRLANHPRVEFAGEVRDIVPYYYKAGIAICPLRQGSGTRLKILEAMALGNPVVSTSIGAEGLDVEPGRNILIADDAETFAQSILKLLRTPETFNAIRRAGRDLAVSQYSWDVIGERMAADMESTHGLTRKGHGLS
ncbi:MAG: glycosyltransferase family 4 protein [Candidatus Omnitrophota bacterium]|nr:glycosyltransferase family 4 protein [Candidatus Omnitrophota bacterium]